MSEFSERLYDCQLLTLFHGVRQNKTACQELWIMNTRKANFSVKEDEWRVYCTKQVGNNTHCKFNERNKSGNNIHSKSIEPKTITLIPSALNQKTGNSAHYACTEQTAIFITSVLNQQR
jgi:hypothetical protein